MSDLQSDLWPTKEQLMGKGWLHSISLVDALSHTPIASLSHQSSSAQMRCLMHTKQGQGFGHVGRVQWESCIDGINTKNPGDVCHKRRMTPWNFHCRSVSLVNFFFSLQNNLVLQLKGHVSLSSGFLFESLLWPVKSRSYWITNQQIRTMTTICLKWTCFRQTCKL